MIEREHVEKILEINGLGDSAGEEDIRSVLVSAKWNDDDVETALTVLKEDKETGKSHTETYKNVFTSDVRLSPESIQNLLGIDVDMSSHEMAAVRTSRQQVSFWQVLTIVIYATLLAFGSILIVMYIQNFGFFHPGV